MKVSILGAAVLFVVVAACDRDGGSGATDAVVSPDVASTDGGQGDATGGIDAVSDVGATDIGDAFAVPDAAADAISDVASAPDGGDPDVPTDVPGTPDAVSDTAGACATPLDAETLANLTFGLLPSVQLQPGATHDFDLGLVECCYTFTPVDTCAVFTVTPDEHATIDPSTGVLTVDAQAPSGTALTVTADVEQGKRVVTIPVYVYTPSDNPLVGLWHEDVQLACGTGAEVVPADTIGELRFDASGDFYVTWYPFEVYYDYWGKYAYSLENGSLDLSVDGGNYVPDDVDGSGTFEIDAQGRLVLHDLFLGSYQSPADPQEPACGHRFVK